MNPVSVLTLRMAGSKSGDRESPRQGDPEPERPPTSLLSFLQAENIRLRQAVLELSLDTTALKEALNRMERSERVAALRPRDRRPLRAGHVSTLAQRARVTKAGWS
jgi:hypothetical protein